jgi:hypothetical protein
MKSFGGEYLSQFKTYVILLHVSTGAFVASIALLVVLIVMVAFHGGLQEIEDQRLIGSFMRDSNPNNLSNAGKNSTFLMESLVDFLQFSFSMNIQSKNQDSGYSDLT